MNNIYVDANDYKSLIVKNNEEDNFQKIEKFENILEEAAVLIFAFSGDRDIFKFMQIPKCGRLAVNKISEVITQILVTNRQQICKLIYLYDVTNQVYENIRHYPSVQSIVKTDKDEIDFMKSLSYFVARHILVHKYKMGRISTKDLKTIVGDYIDIRNAASGTYIGMHQIANKLVNGGLNPKEALSMLKEVVSARRDDLARKSIAYNGGYLGNQSRLLQLDESNNDILRFNTSIKKKKVEKEIS